ncbi:MAG: hypothetical protein AAF846_24075 [Chloroflexota bacterium]
MTWDMRVIIPNRVVYVDYSEDAKGEDVAEALGAVIEEINKRDNNSDIFYCISKSADTNSNTLNDLKSAFSQFRAIPRHTCTLLVSKDKITGFFADVIFSMRALRLVRVDSVEDAIAFIEKEADDLKDKLSIELFDTNAVR